MYMAMFDARLNLIQQLTTIRPTKSLVQHHQMYLLFIILFSWKSNIVGLTIVVAISLTPNFTLDLI